MGSSPPAGRPLECLDKLPPAGPDASRSPLEPARTTAPASDNCALSRSRRKVLQGALLSGHTDPNEPTSRKSRLEQPLQPVLPPLVDAHLLRLRDPAAPGARLGAGAACRGIGSLRTAHWPRGHGAGRMARLRPSPESRAGGERLGVLQGSAAPCVHQRSAHTVKVDGWTS